VLVFAAASPAAAGPRSHVSDLRAQENALASHLQSATVDLYALDAKLSSARARLYDLQTREAQLRGQRHSLALQIDATQHTLHVSQMNLGASLRRIYEQGDQDPLAVILGAESLDDAVTTLDGLKRVTDENSKFVVASLSARHRLQALSRQLASRRAQIDAAVRATATMTRSLASARADRVSFIDGLRTQQQLKASQIQELEAVVQRAETKSKALTAAAAVRGPAPAAVGAPAAPPAPAGDGRTLVVSATAYSLPGHTASGLPVGFGIVAVDPTVIPLGTKMTIPGYGEGIAADVGSGIRGDMIDLWFPSLAQADAWGRRTVTITLH
jgi:3D (Asp-Asp-Asp) domain-containing protein/predicted  nucleic acid-binding Zn-ribbon protein